jgi:histidine phosphotransferase ChpT
MTDAAEQIRIEPADLPMDGPELASLIAAKLCHDFISPSGAIVSGLDLLNDPTAQDMRDDAMNLITDSARKMVALIQFCRVAFGAATTSERFTGAELKGLVDGVIEGGRATLDWHLDDGDLSKVQARTLANLAYLTVAALPSGGVATVSSRREAGALIIEGVAQGARARLKPEATEGLAGERLNVAQASSLLAISATTLRKMEADGRIPARGKDGKWVRADLMGVTA